MTMTKTIVLAAGEGERRWFLGGGLHVWKATAEDTGGAFFVFEDLLMKGKMTPLHRHPHSDEMVYVVEGEILLHVEGEADRRIGTGGMYLASRGTAHAFVVTSDTARVLVMQSPGAGDAFFRQSSTPMPEGDTGPVDFVRLGEIAKATGSTEMLGPPPFAR
jgi:quercetin dioxygenase-like cupin family protein